MLFHTDKDYEYIEKGESLSIKEIDIFELISRDDGAKYAVKQGDEVVQTTKGVLWVERRSDKKRFLLPTYILIAIEQLEFEF